MLLFHYHFLKDLLEVRTHCHYCALKHLHRFKIVKGLKLNLSFDEIYDMYIERIRARRRHLSGFLIINLHSILQVVCFFFLHFLKDLCEVRAYCHYCSKKHFHCCRILKVLKPDVRLGHILDRCKERGICCRYVPSSSNLPCLTV